MRKPPQPAAKSTPSLRWAGVVLAAGQGARMKSQTPKVLQPVCGRPMLSHVLAAVQGAGIPRIVVVTPTRNGAFRQHLDSATEVALQAQPRGTGHAVLAAMPVLEGPAPKRPEHLLVLAGDTPLLRPATLKGLMEEHLASSADVTLLTAVGLPREGLGRVVRNGSGAVARIVEEPEATPAQLRIPEVNSGAYCFRTSALWPRLLELAPSRSGELHLTAVVELTSRSGGRVASVVAEDPWDALGVNTLQQLAQAAGIMRARLCFQWMEQGVTIVDPSSTYLDGTVAIGPDTVIHPNTHLHGRTRIGRGCHLGPWTMVTDSSLGDQCRVIASVLEGATLEDRVEVGPYCHLRPGTHLDQDVHLGNFVEVKESSLGAGVKAGHFSYLGDATIGRNVNIGAGTVTCNYDGDVKNRTIIGEDAFIGSDTMLVAPVRLGARSATGAGAVVTHDVPEDTLVAGVPARPLPRKKVQRRTKSSS